MEGDGNLEQSVLDESMIISESSTAFDSSRPLRKIKQEPGTRLKAMSPTELMIVADIYTACYDDYHHVLHGPNRDPSRNTKSSIAAKIREALISAGYQSRTDEAVHQRIKDTNKSARKALRDYDRDKSKTGGGPPPQDPITGQPPHVQIVIERLSRCPRIVGVPGGNEVLTLQEDAGGEEGVVEGEVNANPLKRVWAQSSSPIKDVKRDRSSQRLEKTSSRKEELTSILDIERQRAETQLENELMRKKILERSQSSLDKLDDIYDRYFRVLLKHEKTLELTQSPHSVPNWVASTRPTPSPYWPLTPLPTPPPPLWLGADVVNPYGSAPS